VLASLSENFFSKVSLLALLLGASSLVRRTPSGTRFALSLATLREMAEEWELRRGGRR